MQRSFMQIRSIYFVMTFLIILLIFLVSLTLVDLDFYIVRNRAQISPLDLQEFKGIDYTNLNQKRFMLLLKDMDTSIQETVVEVFSNQHVDYVTTPSVTKVSDLEGIDCLVVSGTYMTSVLQGQVIDWAIDQNIDIIFTDLPNQGYMRNHSLDNLLGYFDRSNSLITKQVRTLQFFYIGNHTDFAISPLVYTPVQLSATAKAFVDNGQGHPLVWRNSLGLSKVYVFNGSLLTSGAGEAMLTGVLSSLYEDYLYPVVNGLAFTFEGLPYLSSENPSVMSEVYKRNALQVQEDILVPDVIGIMKLRGLVPSLILKPYFNESPYTLSPSLKASISNYERDVLKLKGVVGLAVDTSKEDHESVYKQVINNQDLKVFFDPLSQDLGNSDLTLLTPWYRHVLGHQDQRASQAIVPITYQADASSTGDLDMYSRLTTYGLLVHHLDMYSIIYPRSEKDHWNIRSKTYAEGIDLYLDEVRGLDALNIHDIGQRVKIFKTSVPVIKYSDQDINITVANWQGQMHFILRTDKEVVQVLGGQIEDLGGRAYMVSLNEPVAQIVFDKPTQ